MKTKLTKIALLSLFCRTALFVNPSCAADSATNSVALTNVTSPFAILVTPRKNRIHVNESFQVSLEVKNVSNTNQQFKVWSCSWYWNWRSSNPAIGSVGWPCIQNTAIDINLVPGNSFKEELNGQEMVMTFFQAVSTNKITFRMGFTPTVWGPMVLFDPVHNNSRTNQWWIDGEKTYWSNEVTVELIPD